MLSKTCLISFSTLHVIEMDFELCWFSRNIIVEAPIPDEDPIDNL